MIRRGNLQSELNQYQVINCIRKRVRLSRPELVRLTGLSRPTIDKIVDSFKQQQILTEIGTQSDSSRSGRPAVLLSLDSRSKVVAGIDFECPEIRVILSDLQAHVVDCSSRNYDPDTDADTILRDLAERIWGLLGRNGKSADQLLGIGIAIPGIVDVTAGISVYIERLTRWHDVAIGSYLQERFNENVFIENDVNVMALAERNLGNRELPSNLIYVALRHGIGSAVFIDGHLYEGTRGNSGFLFVFQQFTAFAAIFRGIRIVCPAFCAIHIRLPGRNS